MKSEYWEQVIQRYIASGLKQAEFCALESVPFNKFKYHWKSHREILDATDLLQSPSKLSSFEPINIHDKEIMAKPILKSKHHSLSIKFSNEILCTLDFDGNNIELAMFLKDMAQL